MASSLSGNDEQALDKALADAAIELAAKAVSEADSHRALRRASAAAMLAHAAKGTVGGGALTSGPALES